jgi:hypothetical protein
MRELQELKVDQVDQENQEDPDAEDLRVFAEMLDLWDSLENVVKKDVLVRSVVEVSNGHES